jgi:hypothetical protein
MEAEKQEAMNNSRRLSIKTKMAELTLEGWVGF